MGDHVHDFLLVIEMKRAIATNIITDVIQYRPYHYIDIRLINIHVYNIDIIYCQVSYISRGFGGYICIYIYMYASRLQGFIKKAIKQICV